MTKEVVLLRAVDAGRTYVVWHWSSAPNETYAERLESQVLADALRRLDGSLASRFAGESTEDLLDRVMRRGAFSDLEREMELSRVLASAVLPQRLAEQIRRRAKDGLAVRLCLTPSPRIARVPWELLVVSDDGHRLLDLADVVYAPPVTLSSQPSRKQGSWDDFKDDPGVYVVDPTLPGGEGFIGQALTGDAYAQDLFNQRLTTHANRGFVPAEEVDASVGAEVGRFELSRRLLSRRRSRLLYFGHVSSSPNEPGSAAMHLSDTVDGVWGRALPMGRHRPLAAVDLFAGSNGAPPHHYSAFGSEGPLFGHQIWPMPPRVALIACEAGADYRARETFGLISAMIDSGANLITGTRWTLPTDLAFAPHLPKFHTHGVRPTTRLALVIDEAHTSDDPVATLARWQRQQLDKWRTVGALGDSPLIWAAPLTTVATV